MNSFDIIVCATIAARGIKNEANKNYDEGQMKNYLAHCSDRETFAEGAGRDFVYLLNHVNP